MFTDWTTTQTDDSVIIHQFFGPPRLGVIDTVNNDPYTLGMPIDGTGSCVWHLLNTSTKGTMYRTGYGPVTSGYLRTLWSIQRNPASTGTYAFGMYCYANATDLIHGTGECYLVSLSYFSSEYRIGLYKSKEGVDLAPSADPPANWGLLAQSSAGAWTPGVTFSSELRWFKTVSSVILTYSQGSDTNPLSVFTDLTSVLTYEDTQSPFTTGVQGFWANSDTNNTVTYFMDITQGKTTLPGGL